MKKRSRCHKGGGGRERQGEKRLKNRQSVKDDDELKGDAARRDWRNGGGVTNDGELEGDRARRD